MEIIIFKSTNFREKLIISVIRLYNFTLVLCICIYFFSCIMSIKKCVFRHEKYLTFENLNFAYKLNCIGITDLGQDATITSLVINVYNKDVYYLLQ